MQVGSFSALVLRVAVARRRLQGLPPSPPVPLQNQPSNPHTPQSQAPNCLTPSGEPQLSRYIIRVISFEKTWNRDWDCSVANGSTDAPQSWKQYDATELIADYKGRPTVFEGLRMLTRGCSHRLCHIFAHVLRCLYTVSHIHIILVKMETMICRGTKDFLTRRNYGRFSKPSRRPKASNRVSYNAVFDS